MKSALIPSLEGVQVFDHRTGGPDGVQEAVVTQLYEQIGRLKMELEMIDIQNPEISIRRQCEESYNLWSTLWGQAQINSYLSLYFNGI